MPPSTFHALGVPAPIVEQLDATGITTPFPIQDAVVPDAIAGHDVIGRAPTGSGKTLAFGIPLVARLAAAKRRRPTGIVLAPTRELAEQITGELAPLTSALGHRAVSVYGGVGYGKQRKALHEGAELVVACPGRLEDLLGEGALVLDDVKFVVIDEADRMADMGFLPAVERIVGRTAADRQTLLFSATLDGAVDRLSRKLQRDPVRHEVGPAGPDITSAHHVFWSVEPAERVRWTSEVADQLGSVMVFCRTRRGADRVAKQLGRADVTSAAIHGGRSQAQRDRALRDFTTGKVRALIATDVAARGVHVDDVAAVVHFDPPADPATYIHRSGRTARAGSTGVVVSLWIDGTQRDAQKLQRDIGVSGVLADPDLASLAAPGTAPRPSADRHDRHERDDRHVAAKPSKASKAQSSGKASKTSKPSKRIEPAVPGSSGGHGPHATTGTVVSFHARRGFGFIDAGGNRDVFVHHSNLATAVRQGQRVRFEIREGRRGPEAVAVHAI
jgi:superfamily II DNA/RNA helicase